MAKPIPSKSTALVSYDDEFAKQAQAAAAQEANTGGGSFFSIRGGVLTYDKAPIPNNEIGCIVLDAIMLNEFYATEDFDEDARQPPTCYAYGRDEDEIAPHDEAPDKQSDACKGCEHNEFGSATKGRGKRCKNRRKLALIPAGSFDRNGAFTPNEDGYETATIGYLSLPPTSLTAWAQYVKQLSSAMMRPPHGVFTRVSVKPDPKKQVAIIFECLGKIPNSIVKEVMARHNEAQASIVTAYPKPEEKPAKGKTPPTKGKKY